MYGRHGFSGTTVFAFVGLSPFRANEQNMRQPSLRVVGKRRYQKNTRYVGVGKRLFPKIALRNRDSIFKHLSIGNGSQIYFLSLITY